MDKERDCGIQNPVPLYVIKLDVQKNELIVGEEKDVYSQELVVENPHLLLPEIVKEELEINVKIRYASKEEKAKVIKIEQEQMILQFKHPVKAITPGQSAVFYMDDMVIGGGIIK